MALREDVTRALAEIAELKKEVDDLKRFRSWVTGIAAGIGAILAFFAEGIRKRVGL